MALQAASKTLLRLVLAGIFLLTLAWQHVEALRLGYAVDRAREEIRDLRARTDSKTEDFARLTSCVALERDAAAAGLGPAPVETLRFLDQAPAAPAARMGNMVSALWNSLRGRGRG